MEKKKKKKKNGMCLDLGSMLWLEISRATGESNVPRAWLMHVIHVPKDELRVKQIAS